MRDSRRRHGPARPSADTHGVATRRHSAWPAGLFALAMLLAAAAWFALAQRAPTAVDDESLSLPSSFAWQQGLTRAYRVQLRADARVDFAGFSGQSRPDPAAAAPPAETIRLVSDARLWLRSFAGSTDADGNTPLAGVLVAPRYRVNGEEQDAAALAQPFVVDIDSRGRLANLRTIDGLPAHAHAVLRSLLDAMQFVLPEQPATQWQHHETLDDDPLLTLYHREPVVDARNAHGITVSKRSEHAPAGLIGSRGQPDVVTQDPPGLSGFAPDDRGRLDVQTAAHRIEATMLVSPDPAQWLLAVDLSASIQRMRDGREVGRTQYTVTARALGAADIARGDPTLAGSLQQALAALRQPWQDATLLAESRSLLASLGVDPPASAVAALYAQLQARRFVEVEQMVLAWLRDQPGRADALMAFLRTLPDGALTQDAELSLWRLLARAGTDEAQAAMLAALTDAGHGEQAQLRAAMHLGEIANPSAATLEQLLAFSASFDADASGHQRMLANTALLAAGALAGPRTVAVDEHGRMLADAVADTLNQRFALATAPSEQRAVLAAIGNQGHPAGLATIELALAADDRDTRALAYQSLRHMPPAPAAELLQAGFAVERDPQVQVAALATLAQLPPSRQTLDWADGLLQQPSDPRVTRALVDVLGNARRAFPEADAALRELLQQQPPRDVRAAIYQHLGPGG